MTGKRQWLIFALAGLAAGWLAATLFSCPLVELVPWRSPLTTALCGAVAFALAGWWLDRPVTMGSMVPGARLAWAVLAAGALAGGLSGSLVAYGQTGRAHLVAAGGSVGALLGLLTAVALLPGFSLLSRAACEEGIARAGSLVGRSEARRGWIVLTSFVTVALLASVPDWIAYGGGLAERPWHGDLIAAVLACGVVGLAVLELAALRRIARAAGAHAVMEPVVDDPDEVAQRCEAFIDLGVGEGLTGTRRRGSPYRAVERLCTVVYGDAELARSLSRVTLRRAAATLLVIGVVVGAERTVAHPAVALWVQQERCAAGSVAGCYQGWSMIRDGRATAFAAGQQELLISRACALGLSLRPCEGRETMQIAEVDEGVGRHGPAPR